MEIVGMFFLIPYFARLVFPKNCGQFVLYISVKPPKKTHILETFLFVTSTFGVSKKMSQLPTPTDRQPRDLIRIPFFYVEFWNPHKE